MTRLDDRFVISNSLANLNPRSKSKFSNWSNSTFNLRNHTLTVTGSTKTERKCLKLMRSTSTLKFQPRQHIRRLKKLRFYSYGLRRVLMSFLSTKTLQSYWWTIFRFSFQEFRVVWWQIDPSILIFSIWKATTLSALEFEVRLIVNR